MKTDHKHSTLSFLRRQESIPGRRRGASVDRRDGRDSHSLMRPAKAMVITLKTDYKHVPPRTQRLAPRTHKT